ncbi:unnamed protein product [Miscanthus lutarioriparius]|uniref:Uncharacterized protein n=1 Tax=Miscanthus lutarioriparius TaxID=422564 RepID=A0A811SEJ1_9POAL|nr:unnamed protein product [Miscanthus lutarioriparius]
MLPCVSPTLPFFSIAAQATAAAPSGEEDSGLAGKRKRRIREGKLRWRGTATRATGPGVESVLVLAKEEDGDARAARDPEEVGNGVAGLVAEQAVRGHTGVRGRSVGAHPRGVDVGRGARGLRLLRRIGVVRGGAAAMLLWPPHLRGPRGFPYVRTSTAHAAAAQSTTHVRLAAEASASRANEPAHGRSCACTRLCRRPHARSSQPSSGTHERLAIPHPLAPGSSRPTTVR